MNWKAPRSRSKGAQLHFVFQPHSGSSSQGFFFKILKLGNNCSPALHFMFSGMSPPPPHPWLLTTSAIPRCPRSRGKFQSLCCPTLARLPRELGSVQDSGSGGTRWVPLLCLGLPRVLCQLGSRLMEADPTCHHCCCYPWLSPTPCRAQLQQGRRGSGAPSFPGTAG